MNFKVLSILSLSAFLVGNCVSIYSADLECGIDPRCEFFPRKVNKQVLKNLYKSQSPQTWIQPGNSLHQFLTQRTKEKKQSDPETQKAQIQFPSNYWVRMCSDPSVKKQLMSVLGSKKCPVASWKKFLKSLKGTTGISLSLELRRGACCPQIKFFPQYFKEDKKAPCSFLTIGSLGNLNNKKVHGLLKKIKGNVILKVPPIELDSKKAPFQQTFAFLNYLTAWINDVKLNITIVIQDQFIIRKEEKVAWLDLGNFINFSPKIYKKNEDHLKLLASQQDFRTGSIGTRADMNSEASKFNYRCSKNWNSSSALRLFDFLNPRGVKLEKLHDLTIDARLVKPPKPYRGTNYFYIDDFLDALKSRGDSPLPALKTLALKLGVSPAPKSETQDENPDWVLNLAPIFQKLKPTQKVDLQFTPLNSSTLHNVKNVEGLGELKRLSELRVSGILYISSGELQKALEKLSLEKLTLEVSKGNFRKEYSNGKRNFPNFLEEVFRKSKHLEKLSMLEFQLPPLIEGGLPSLELNYWTSNIDPILRGPSRRRWKIKFPLHVLNFSISNMEKDGAVYYIDPQNPDTLHYKNSL